MLPHFLLAFLGSLFALVLSAGEPLSARPNIVIILADDFGFADPSCYGGTVPTPQLDRMAKEGTRYTRFYVASPICSPSRAALITGQFPPRWRITSFLQTREGNRGCEMADFLDPRAPSLPRILKNSGYATAHIGKWHLGGGRDVTNAPPFRAYGFDLGVGTYESPEPHPDITATNWIWSAYDKVKRHERTRWMVDQALSFLHQHRGQPCFVNIWLDDTHTPFVPSPEQLAAAGAKVKQPREWDKYRAVLIEMDRQIGRFLDGLRSSGIAERTLVLFLGDNGALPTFGGKRNGPLRASKLSLYDGGIRVPFIAWWPGHVTAGRVDQESVLAAVDFLPTLLAVSGARDAAVNESDGENFSVALSGEAFRRAKPLFWEYGRNDKWFKFPAAPGDRSPNLAMREDNWKLLVNADGSGAELYNVVEDPGEARDLAMQNEQVTARMRQAVLAWRKSLP